MKCYWELSKLSLLKFWHYWMLQFVPLNELALCVSFLLYWKMSLWSSSGVLLLTAGHWLPSLKLFTDIFHLSSACFLQTCRNFPGIYYLSVVIYFLLCGHQILKQVLYFLALASFFARFDPLQALLGLWFFVRDMFERFLRFWCHRMFY